MIILANAGFPLRTVITNAQSISLRTSCEQPMNIYFSSRGEVTLSEDYRVLRKRQNDIELTSFLVFIYYHVFLLYLIYSPFIFLIFYSFFHAKNFEFSFY